MKELINPDLFHGKHKKSNYFEGWYFKLVNEDDSRVLAFIPGISLDESSINNHSFIQVLDGNKGAYTYCKYNKNDFKYSNSPFNIKVNSNSFSLNSMNLNINTNDLSIIGSVTFKNIIKWNDSIINPGSMGFYNYLPFMECYAQVCAVDGQILGKININGEVIDFTNGKIYIEKNWGKSFPKEWLWIQCNSFLDKRATLTCSLGKIPFPIRDFTGFLIGVTVNNKFYKFTTINRSKISISYTNNGVEVNAIHNNIKLSLITSTDKDNFMLCYGPKNGYMSPYVLETLVGTIYMKLTNIKTNSIIYAGTGNNVGVEYGGTLMDNMK